MTRLLAMQRIGWHQKHMHLERLLFLVSWSRHEDRLFDPPVSIGKHIKCSTVFTAQSIGEAKTASTWATSKPPWWTCTPPKWHCWTRDLNCVSFILIAFSKQNTSRSWHAVSLALTLMVVTSVAASWSWQTHHVSSRVAILHHKDLDIHIKLILMVANVVPQIGGKVSCIFYDTPPLSGQHHSCGRNS